MDVRLRDHRPGLAALRLAEAQGLDLEVLKRERPQAYMALNAVEALRAAPPLAELAGGMLLAAFPNREVFRLPEGSWVRLLAFPELAVTEEARLDRLLAPLADRPEWRRRYAFYREVSDARGRRRELGLPEAPAAYAGGDAVIGPFSDRAGADGWAAAHVPPPRVHDVFVLAGRWFCDVFPGDPGQDVRAAR